MAKALAAHQVNNLLAQILSVISGSFERLGDEENSAAITGAVCSDDCKMAAENLVTGPIYFRIGPQDQLGGVYIATDKSAMNLFEHLLQSVRHLREQRRVLTGQGTSELMKSICRRGQ